MPRRSSGVSPTLLPLRPVIERVRAAPKKGSTRQLTQAARRRFLSGRAAMAAFRGRAHIDHAADVRQRNVEAFLAFDAVHRHVVRLIRHYEVRTLLGSLGSTVYRSNSGPQFLRWSAPPPASSCPSKA